MSSLADVSAFEKARFTTTSNSFKSFNKTNTPSKSARLKKLVLGHEDTDDDTISHGGPGSGRYPKGFKMAKEVSSATEKTAKAVKNAIPSRYNYQVSSHPSYDELSDEYMRKVISRKNLETDYAKAVGELKQKPSKGKIAMEALEIIGAIAAIGVSTSLMLVNMNNIVNGKDAEKDKKD